MGKTTAKMGGLSEERHKKRMEGSLEHKGQQQRKNKPGRVCVNSLANILSSVH